MRLKAERLLSHSAVVIVVVDPQLDHVWMFHRNSSTCATKVLMSRACWRNARCESLFGAKVVHGRTALTPLAFGCITIRPFGTFIQFCPQRHRWVGRNLTRFKRATWSSGTLLASSGWVDVETCHFQICESVVFGKVRG